MEDVRFKSLEELYTRLLPAFAMSKNTLKTSGMIVSEKEIWFFLKETKWQNNKELHLYDMVNDILNVNKDELEQFLKSGAK